MSHRTVTVVDPGPRLLPPARLEEIRCQALSGIGLEAPEVLELLADRELLRQSLVMRTSRLSAMGEEADDH